MKIEYLGHSSFLITTDSGVRVLTDPYDPEGYPGKLNYAVLDEPVDVVTVSHEHPDHGAVGIINGSPIIIKGNGKFSASGVSFLGVQTFHDNSGGSERGKNTFFVIEADGLRIGHAGDLGHVLTGDQASEIGDVDVALLPIGGYYTIDAKEADRVAQQLNANIIIPMHYSTEKCLFPIASIDSFTQGKDNVFYTDGSDLDITCASLPKEQQVIVLRHSM